MFSNNDDGQDCKEDDEDAEDDGSEVKDNHSQFGLSDHEDGDVFQNKFARSPASPSTPKKGKRKAKSAPGGSQRKRNKREEQPAPTAKKEEKTETAVDVKQEDDEREEAESDVATPKLPGQKGGMNDKLRRIGTDLMDMLPASICALLDCMLLGSQFYNTLTFRNACPIRSDLEHFLDILIAEDLTNLRDACETMSDVQGSGETVHW